MIEARGAPRTVTSRSQVAPNPPNFATCHGRHRARPRQPLRIADDCVLRNVSTDVSKASLLMDSIIGGQRVGQKPSGIGSVWS